VLSFITRFGGGKTHTLTALWHLAGIGPDAARLPGVPELLARERLPAIPRAKLGVFVLTHPLISLGTQTNPLAIGAIPKRIV
jgi:hypothetical protein